jgi:RNA polymerase sigma-70 factor (ECF subfamily)
MSRLDDLYARYLRPLIEVVKNRGASEDDAQDIAQETLIETWKRLDHVAPDKERAYLMVAALNRAKKRFSRARPTTSLDGFDGQAPSAEKDVIEKQETARFHDRFKAAMRQLPPETQKALYLRAQGLGSKEIAQKLELTDQAVRTRLSRAFERIREQVGDPPSGVEWMSLPGDHDDHQE